MSTKTRGFFEQHHGQQKQPWRRHRSDAPLNAVSTNARPPKPPIPANSQTKSKLKAFAFVGEEHVGEQENEVELETSDTLGGGEDQAGGEARTNGEATSTAGQSSGFAKETGQPNKTPQLPQLPHANTFPSTPGMRIPLEELIGNFDESVKKVHLPEESPEERIGWIPNSSSTLLTPNRKRKRARSSSPSCPTTASQRNEAASFVGTTAAQADKRTPEADPAAALWKQYADHKGQDVNGENGAGEFGRLMFERSPRALETPAKGAGFRRWASTGNDWPTSRTKKRRTTTKSGISLWQDAPVIESAGRSKVSDLVDKIQESLATQRLASSETKPAVRISAPSSSSPLPEAGGTDLPNRAPAASPLQARQQSNAQRLEPVPSRAPTTSSRPLAGQSVQCTVAEEKEGHRPVDPNGDSFRLTKLHLQSKGPLPAYKRPSITRASSNDAQKDQLAPPPAAPAVNPKPTCAVELDEFGEGFDLSAEDLDELMDTQPPLNQRPLHQIPAHPDPPPSKPFDPSARQRGAVATGQANQPIVLNEFDDDDDDEFACDDIDEASLAQAEFSATQAFRKSPRKRSPRKARNPKKSPKKNPQFKANVEPSVSMVRPLQRYRITHIVEGEYTNAKGRQCLEKLLLADEEKTKRPTAISLRDSWFNTSLAVDATVHVASVNATSVASTTPPGQITISDAEESQLLIVHPDHMLSATDIANSMYCIRKAVLQDRIRATNDTCKPMVYGKILHEIFQQALSANEWDDVFLADVVERTVQNHIESLWELGMEDTVLAVEELRAKMSELAAWSKKFVAAAPSDSSLVDEKQGQKVWLSISKLIAVEEHIWSPQFGLKGNIDASVQTTVMDHANEPMKKLIAPFEVKTGKREAAEHVVQTALYTLLMSDRYDVDIKAGILYYLESSKIMLVAPRPREIRLMIQQRNRLASYLHRAKQPIREMESQPPPQTQEIEASGLPGMLRNPNACGRCFAQASCFAYHALVENGDSESAGLIDNGRENYSLTWHEGVGHLRLAAGDQAESRALKAWFTKWDRLLTLEDNDVSRYLRELWTMNSAEREAVGRCFGNMVLAQDMTPTASSHGTSIDGIEGSGGKINRYAYRFVRSDRSKKTPLNEGTQMSVGETVVVSSEGGQWALAKGFVVASSKRDITVAVDRRLGDARERTAGFDAGRNQTLKGVMTVGYEDDSVNKDTPKLLYRLDKDEFSNGLSKVRNNLVTLMSTHPMHTKLRKQIVLDLEPVFATPSARSLRASQLTEMNEDQQAAVSKVLSARDYALVLGMPGTGKTTTIAQLIGALLVEGKSVLLTAYQHTAVDNILLKIRDIAPANSILRLGNPTKINSEVQKFCRLENTPRSTIAEVDETFMSCRIVATTCHGTSHALFNRRAFDICIVDEASQITLPTSLGPLLHARRFVLVGDHYQLPPLVQDKAALEGGLDVSLFRQLSEQHPDAVATLGKQYRMCEEIMSLSNALIYEGQLRCGNDEVAGRTLQVSRMDALATFHTASQSCAALSRQDVCWLEELCKTERKVVFADTDAAGKTARETLTLGKNITNQLEATLTAQLVLALLAIGVPAREIGVITLYRSQLALLRQLFKTASITNEVEIDSADRYQGRDKECVILSMVRSNEAGIVGDLLKDWRRVNVALTRARSKLIVLGSRQTLRNNDLLGRFLRLVDEKLWTLELPADAGACHSFPFSSQASSLTTPGTAKKGDSMNDVRPSPSPSKWPRVLQQSTSAGNASSIKKRPGKVISGKTSQKQAEANEDAAIHILDDIMGEDWGQMDFE